MRLSEFLKKIENKIAEEETRVEIIDGKQIDYLPAAVDEQLKVKPIYKTFDGWKCSTKGIKNFEKLPEKAKTYILELEKFIGAKVSSISTSPERNEVCFCCQINVCSREQLKLLLS